MTREILKIEKRPLPYWLIYAILALPFLWGTLFSLLHLPSFLKYSADLAWVCLLCYMLFRKKIGIDKKVAPLLILVCLFFFYCLVLYLFRYQSVIYFLWGARNNFRYYVFFFSIVMFLYEEDAGRFFKIVDALFWINAPCAIFQYFVFDHKQDYLGGIFGTEVGVNAMTIIFFAIVLSRSLLRYMEQNEHLWQCALKCAVALLLSALAELKFFFVFFLIILVLSAVLTAFSWRKVLILSLCAGLVSAASTLLVMLFDFEDFLSLENIWKVATQKYYSSAQTVNRLSAIPTLTQLLVKEFWDQLFGLGLGNCDTSSFAICNTPFFELHGYLRYSYFSVAFLFLEVGYLGLLIYTLFFIFCFVMIRKRLKAKLCNRHHGQVALIMTVLAIILIFYNASLRAEAGYMVYFVLALPFLSSKPYPKKLNTYSEESED